MFKGLRKVLGKPGKKQAAQKASALDVSHRSASSAAQSELFPCDLGSELDIAGWQDPSLHSQSSQQPQQQQQPPHQQQQPTSNQQPPRLSAAVIQQHLQLQAELQKLDADTDSSTSKRQAAALQKRINNAMLNPSTCLYQISSLLSLSTLFEHKLQRDTLQALRQMPGSLFQAAAAAAQSSRCEQHSSSGSGVCEAGSDGACDGTCCCGPSGRTPSATAASTAHVALQLSRWGYRVIVRKVLHSKAYWTKSMDNTFIVALDTSSGGHVEYVVDPHFRETFNVGVMSSNYSAVWHSLPQVFVGMPCQLQPVVQLLCEEMELSFLEAGRPCPPWRSWAATINRWMSDQYVDILVPDAAAPEAEVVEYISRCCQISSQACGPCGGTSSASTATTASTTCSPMYGLQQQRLTDKMHVSSVLSSASTSSRRPVQEPQHKQLGVDAGTIMETDMDPPSQLRDASFTSVASSGSTESAALVAAAVAAAATAAATAKPAPGPHSLSVPSADCCSSLSSSIELGAADTACGDLAVAAAAAAAATQQQRQQQAAAQLAAATAAASTRAAAAAAAAGASAAGQPTRDDQHQHEQHRGRASSSSSSSRASGSGGTKSLLTAQMQLKAQLLQQQQQQQLLLFPFGSSSYGMLHPQQQQLHQQQAALLQQQQPQAAQQLVQLQLQLQQQSSNLQLQQQLALQQQQQQLLLAQHQIVAQQQQQQQQQAVAQLLPVVHTVRPCGVPAVPQHQQPMQQPMQQQPYVQQLHLQQQQQPRAPLFGLPALQQLQQAAVMTQEQPRLLRLIQRTKQ